MSWGIPFWSSLFIVLALDQGTKALALRGLPYGVPVGVIGQFFRLTLIFNEGALFGLGRGMGWIYVVSAVAFLLLFPLLFRPRTYGERIAVGLLAGGVAGNALDRLRFGGAVDFLDFGWGSLRWPVFNFADVAICVGVGLLVLKGMRK